MYVKHRCVNTSRAVVVTGGDIMLGGCEEKKMLAFQFLETGF